VIFSFFSIFLLQCFFFSSGFSFDLLPSGVSVKKKKKLRFSDLSLVIADINYYYLFLLFDLTFIVGYFQILIKRPVQLCTFKTIPVVACVRVFF